MPDHVAYFAEHIAPLRRDPGGISQRTRRSAVLLAGKIGPARAAYVFNVRRRTVNSWMSTVLL